MTGLGSQREMFALDKGTNRELLEGQTQHEVIVPRYDKKGTGFKVALTWFPVPVLRLLRCVALGKSLAFLSLRFFHL